MSFSHLEAVFCMTRSYRGCCLTRKRPEGKEIPTPPGNRKLTSVPGSPGNNKNSMWALFMIRNVKKQRPVNLDLQTIRFPITAIASILHRVSGVITFVAVGILLWLLGTSLSSPEGFDKLPRLWAASSSNLSCGASLPLWRITSS